MQAPQLQTLALDGLRMQVATQGSGPLVILCHGFPELWVSWRRQMAALAAAGYRAAAPDMRGYGGTDAPADPAQYTMLHHVGDMVGLVRALGEKEAVIVGHDWGAPVAWTAAMVRPDVFRAVAGLSVPYQPPASIDLYTALEKNGIHTFYMQYFRTPGVGEAELQADVASTLRRVNFSLSGDGAGGVCTVLAPGQRFLDKTVDPPSLPAWVDADDLAYAIAQFERSGFQGGLNWYRAVPHSWAVMRAWHGVPIRQPSLYLCGDRDDVYRFPTTAPAIARYAETLPGLRGSHVITGAGHWLQRERSDEVNRLLLAFLDGL